MGYDYGTKRTAEQAEQEVDSYVEPRKCFITYIDNRWGWQSFSTTGDTPCAHYVSHVLGLKKRNGAVCRLGYLCRVSDLVAELGDPMAADDVQAGDVWARQKGSATAGGGKEPTSHCGMISKVVRAAGAVPSITIKHCSSGQQRVAENDWAAYFGAGGQFYRLKSSEVNSETHVNREDLVRGFAYRSPLFG